MNITFTINVQGEIRLPDIALLAQAMMGRPQPEAVTAPQPTAPTPAPQPAVNPTPAAVIPQTAAPTAPSAPAPSPVTPTVPVTEAPKYSIDDIARAGAELAQQGPDKIAALTGLLQQFGLQAVTQLRTEQMGPFVLALRGMGARI